MELRYDPTPDGVKSQVILLYDTNGIIFHSHEFLHHNEKLNEATLKEFERMAIETARESPVAPGERIKVKYKFPEEYFIYHVPEDFRYEIGVSYKIDLESKRMVKLSNGNYQ